MLGILNRLAPQGDRATSLAQQDSAPDSREAKKEQRELTRRVNQLKEYYGGKYECYLPTDELRDICKVRSAEEAYQLIEQYKLLTGYNDTLIAVHVAASACSGKLTHEEAIAKSQSIHSALENKYPGGHTMEQFFSLYRAASKPGASVDAVMELFVSLNDACDRYVEYSSIGGQTSTWDNMTWNADVVKWCVGPTGKVPIFAELQTIRAKVDTSLGARFGSDVDRKNENCFLVAPPQLSRSLMIDVIAADHLRTTCPVQGCVDLAQHVRGNYRLDGETTDKLLDIIASDLKDEPERTSCTIATLRDAPEKHRSKERALRKLLERHRAGGQSLEECSGNMPDFRGQVSADELTRLTAQEEAQAVDDQEKRRQRKKSA